MSLITLGLAGLAGLLVGTAFGRRWKPLSDVFDLTDAYRPGYHDHNKVVAFIVLVWVLVDVTVMLALRIVPNGWHFGIFVALLAAGFGPRVFLKYLRLRNGVSPPAANP